MTVSPSLNPFVAPAARRTHELRYALLGILVATLIYVGLVLRTGVPRPGSWGGLGLGIAGFLLMLGTELLYSRRKRARGRTFGSMSTWLQIHVVTGIVGPYLILLHSAGHFHGLAGWVTVMALIVMGSGFVGRYIYTAVPRTADGTELAISELEEQIAAADANLNVWRAHQPLAVVELSRRLASIPPAPADSLYLVLGRALMLRGYWHKLREEINRLHPTDRAPLDEMARLLQKRFNLERSLRALAMTRRLLSAWHSIHVPLGAVLFTSAAVHIGGAIYYSFLAR
jgi:hypothetical protein